MMFTLLWQVDTFLAVLFIIGFVLFLFVTMIGMAVDKIFDIFYTAKRFIAGKIPKFRAWLDRTMNKSFAFVQMDP